MPFRLPRPQIFHTTFSPSRSRKFPLLLHAHNLKYVLASGDADSIAARLSSDLQAGA